MFNRNNSLEITILILCLVLFVNTGLGNNDDYQGKSTFECDYLGQELPGNIPEKFAPGIVSTNDDDSCFEISISGKEIIFSREMKIYIIIQDQNGVWSSPSPLSFSGGETSLSKDGKKIYFNSRDHFPGAKVPLNVWVAQKLNDQWNKPFPLGEPAASQTVHAPTVAGNGNIYASGIIRLKFIDGEYQPPEQLIPEIKGTHPFISADESFMIFDKRPMLEGNPADLFITFHNSNDTWTEPVRLGEEINTLAMETNAFVTPDEKYMFFTRKFDVYWVKADFIGKIKNQVQPFSLEISPQIFDPVWSFQPGLADLDGDGDLDVVLANMGRNFTQILFNNGKGEFEDSGQKLTQQGHGVGIGDLDGDGDPDCIVTCAGYGENDVYTYKPTKIYLNDGTGVLLDSGQDFGDGVKDRGGYVAGISDLDGDGDLDFVKGLFRAPAKIFLNDGSGRFSDSGTILPQNSFLGDLDGDGDVDVFVKDAGVGYRALLNNGDLDFVAHWKGEDVHSLGSVKDVAMGDLDGDGDLDAFIANGDRSGSFPSAVWINDGTGRFTDSSQELGMTFFGWVVLGDLDGDGSLDAFISNFQQPNQIWLNDGKGNFADSGLRLSGEAATRGCALGDLDGDSDLDIFVANFRTGSNEIWFNRSDGHER